ncbi:hypothetical protein BDV18DRAFT_137071 [Aspergillus unguis]
MIFKLPTLLASLAVLTGSLTTASPVPTPTPIPSPAHPPAFHSSPLEVTLHHLTNTTLRAEVTNTGSDTLHVLKSGSILDTSPGKKVIVEDKTGSKLPYTGLDVHVLAPIRASAPAAKRIVITPATATPESMISLAANESVHSVFDIAAEYDLVSGEVYTVYAQGQLQYVTMTRAKGSDDGFLDGEFRSNVVVVRAP